MADDTTDRSLMACRDCGAPTVIRDGAAGDARCHRCGAESFTGLDGTGRG